VDGQLVHEEIEGPTSHGSAEQRDVLEEDILINSRVVDLVVDKA
jgi:hypothetical protein